MCRVVITSWEGSSPTSTGISTPFTNRTEGDALAGEFSGIAPPWLEAGKLEVEVSELDVADKGASSFELCDGDCGWKKLP